MLMKAWGWTSNRPLLGGELETEEDEEGEEQSSGSERLRLRIIVGEGAGELGVGVRDCGILEGWMVLSGLSRPPSR